MMKRIIIPLVLLGGLLTACDKNNEYDFRGADLTNAHVDDYVRTELDRWLDTNFVTPYNIQVLYRFDRFQYEIDKDLAPVEEELVKPVMEMVRSVWLEPYEELAGKEFLMPIVPKQIGLVGSASYNQDQTVTLGTADAGRQINLFALNALKYGDEQEAFGTLIQGLHTIHHEFAHILHQKVPIDAAFESISSAYVGGTWASITNTEEAAMENGYISRYARMNKDEDFVETVAFLLVEGQAFFDAYVAEIPEESGGREKLRLKEQYVVDYYRRVYNIDFRLLQQRVAEAIDNLFE